MLYPAGHRSGSIGLQRVGPLTFHDAHSKPSIGSQPRIIDAAQPPAWKAYNRDWDIEPARFLRATAPRSKRTPVI